MEKLLGPDSPIIRKATAITNLFLLNILWLICCIPVVTAGAATTAMYYTLYQHITNQDDAVVKPFFRAFRMYFKQSTLIWLSQLVLGIILLFDGAYLIIAGLDNAHVFWIALFVMLFIFLVVTTHSFAILGRYDIGTKQLIRNCFVIYLLNLIRSTAIVALSVAPVLVLVFLPNLVLKTLPAWIAIIFAVVFYINAKMFLHSFDKSVAKPAQQISEQETDEILI